jgi:hypothetical protein
MPLPAGDFPGANKQPLDYPGSRPDYSFVYYRGEVYQVEARGPALSDLRVTDSVSDMALDEFLASCGDAPLADRTAVLAVGSNGCPGRLEEKYGVMPDAAIPVLLGSMTEAAVVYSRRLASYGALPATYLLRPGASSGVFVTLLTEGQLKVMDDSESLGESYQRIETQGVFTAPGGLRIERPFAYLDRRVLAYRGTPVLLKAFAAEDLDWPAMDEREVLALVLDEAGILRDESVAERHRILTEDAQVRAQLRDFVDRSMSGLRVDAAGNLS